MATNWKSLAENAHSRSHIYGILATVFRSEPTQAFIKELRGPRLSGVFSELGVELGDEFFNIPESELKEILEVEFTRLFIGPENHISAHESIFTEMDGCSAALWGTTTVEVKNFIETTGLDYDPKFNGIPDHISVELEFMQKLAEWEADKWGQNDKKNAQYGQKVQSLFLQKHLLCWAPQLCSEVMSRAEIPFYRAMAELCSNYIEFERQVFATDTAA